MLLLDLLMLVWAYESNRWLYEIVRHVTWNKGFFSKLSAQIDPFHGFF